MPEPTPLITESDFRKAFNISSKVSQGQIVGALAQASITLRSWVGDEAYADAASDEAQDKSRQQALDFAEGLLAMHYALLGFNSQIGPDGIIKASRDEGDVVQAYLTPKETIELRQAYFDQARTVAGPYLLAEESYGSSSIPFIVVE